jgi:hypothetical protein
VTRVIMFLLYFLTVLIATASGQVYAPTRVTVQDEGVSQGTASVLNFTGTGIAATVSGATATVTFTPTVTIATAALCCITDGLARFTVTDAAVTASSSVLVSVRRPDVTDVNDHGWLFIANVVKISSGSFDVLISVLEQPGRDSLVDPPSGPLTLTYTVGS